MTNRSTKSKKVVAISFNKMMEQIIGGPVSSQIQNEKESDKLKRFSERFAYGDNLNKPIFKILSDYFNILKEKADLQKEHEIKLLGFMKDDEFRDNLNLQDIGRKLVFLEYEGLMVSCCFDVYKQQNEMFYELSMSSNEKTYVDAEFFYKKIWAHALQVSDLKGSYFTMERDELQWAKKPLEQRSFDDIYLPQSTINDLRLYVATHSEANKLMRYLMVGNPGTGKTESTLVLANELNKLGVTIIKTPVCEAIKDKVELASLLSPSLLIFDDIDLSLGSRKSGAYSERLQDFLDVMDGTDKVSNKVGMIATTNSVALLDLAAQRPGRFDKTLSFDELTLDNIKNVILKALKYEYQLSATSPVAKMFADEKIVKFFKEASVTGAHIYNSVKMLKLQGDMLKQKFTTELILEEFSNEIKSNDKMRKTDFLTDKLNSDSRKTIGFSEDEDGDDNYGGGKKRRAGFMNEKLSHNEAVAISLDKNIFPD